MKNKRVLIIISAVVVLGVLAGAVLFYVGKKPSKGSIALVNGEAITKADFDREVQSAQLQVTASGRVMDENQIASLKKEVLERLINIVILYQESSRRGIVVEEAAVSEKMKALKAGFPSEEEFKNALNKSEISEPALKEQIQKGLMVDEFVSRDFFNKVTVTDTESRSYYDSHPEAFKDPEQVRVSHILIKVTPEADKEQKIKSRHEMEKIQKRVKGGEDFSSLAGQFSECPSKAQGGDLGFLRRGQTVKPFEEAAFSLQPGQTSDIVETIFGYHLVKVTEKKPEGTISFEAVKEKLAQYLKQQKAQEELNRFIEKIKASSKVERYL